MNARAVLVLFLTLAGAFAAGPPANAAERLVISVSTHRVLITSNFTGTEVVLFGTIERDEGAKIPEGGYDVVVTVRGPEQNFVTRRKDRVLGLWVNVDSRLFIEVPSYLAVSTSRPAEEIGPPSFLRRYRIGLVNHTLQQRIGADFGDVVPHDPFRTAFLRVKEEQGLFIEEPQGVTFVTPNFFRAAIPIPGTAPTGVYEVEALLISDAQVRASETTAIEVLKTGFEELFAKAAREHGFLYGLVTALLALSAGFIAYFIFRQD